MFGIPTYENEIYENEIFVNHILLASKQYLVSSCQQNKSLPSIKALDSKIKMIHQLETMIAKSNINKVSASQCEMEQVPKIG